MPEKRFEHFTFNTGHCMFQTMKYFHPNPVVNANLRQLVQKALQPEGTKVIGNIFFKLTEEDDTYVGSVYSHVGEETVPLLITCGVKTEEAGEKLWNSIQDDFKKFPDIVRMKGCRPRAPFVADYIFGFIPDLHAAHFFLSGMSGDFCKCIGWALLFPEVIASHEPPTCA